MSLKQIINNEEEAWVQHREQLNEKLTDNADLSLRHNTNRVELTERQKKLNIGEFDKEISELTRNLKEKILSLKKDYRDMKIFKNDEDIENSREKLLIFIKKLIYDINMLINSIQL